LTVGQLAERFGVSVRTLHHYDEIGLLAPSGRSVADYRLYTEADVVRLQQVVVYRRLGFALKAIGLLLDDPDADVEQHLRRQRQWSSPGWTACVLLSRPLIEHWRMR
jgi:DNA-binding transcriptional MerR regulator